MSERLPAKEISALVGCSARTVRRILQTYRETGRVSRKPLQVGRPRELTGLEVSYLESLIERQPDMLLDELRQQLVAAYGVEVNRSTISRCLRQRGYSYKQIARPALERNEDVRFAYMAKIREQYPAETLVFLDESACNRFTTRRTHGWSPVGDRARRHDYFVRGTRYSILPAISLDGVLHLDILTRSWNATEFEKFIDVLLDNMNPWPQKNSVLVMDNASIHHFEGLRQIVESRGRRLLYLPPYSPDLNPIEEGFSAMKAWILRNKDYIRGEMGEEASCDPRKLLWDAVYSTMTPENIRGWFTHSGYTHWVLED